MCIIIHKPAGIDCPNEAIIENCFANNPDGAGIAILRKHSNTVEIYKGFMELSAFQEFCKLSVNKDDIAAYHFRWATGGGVIPENTHPFPITPYESEIKALQIKTRYAFLHNGVISEGNKTLSDTQLYILNTLSKKDLSKGITRKLIKQIKADTLGSRCLIIDGLERKVFKTGNWIDDKDTGLLFSNDDYLYNKNTLYVADNFDYSLYSREDREICPVCQFYTELISEYHDLWECTICHSISDGHGNIVLPGDPEIIKNATEWE